MKKNIYNFGAIQAIQFRIKFLDIFDYNIMRSF